MRFHTAVNQFCLNAALGKHISVYKTALHQYRPYLSLKDAYKTFKYAIENDLFENDIYNVLSENCTVNQILKKLKDIRKTSKLNLLILK